MTAYNSAQEAIKILGSCILKLPSKKVYIGITHDVDERINTHSKEYNITDNLHCKIQCTSDTVSRAVEKHFIEKRIHGEKQILGGGGGGDNTAVFVYAFSYT